MGRTGVTQDDVFRAADALVARGERPTIERLRAELGTGSPNTLIRHLEAWWSGLATRLEAHARAIALPEAPVDVVAAATHLWTRALEVAHEQAGVQNAEVRRVLEGERAALAERETLAATERTMALDKVAAAEARLADLQRLVDTQSAQLLDLQQQRDGAIASFDTVQRALEGVQTVHAEQLATLLRERETNDAQHRAVEARWMRETDRARQESITLQRQLEREKGEHARERAELRGELKGLRLELRASERQRSAREAEVLRLQRELDRARAGRTPAKTTTRPIRRTPKVS